jgi:predicted metal-dependent phosphoesterase TrpH
VARAARAGVSVLSVTDHDTVLGCDPVAAACASAGIEFVAGIEITAVRIATDVHVLGYFIDTRAPALLDFLGAQRRQRLERVRLMIDRLADFGVALDADAILGPGMADSGKAAGRPWIARALVAGGHVKTPNEAFDRWLARGRPAFVPRVGATPEEVFTRIHAAGGVASLAHPGLLGCDEWIPGFVTAGLDAIEVYHSAHAADATLRYRQLAVTHNLGMSGGSDYHGDEHHGSGGPGNVSLPRADFDRLVRLKPSAGC